MKLFSYHESYILHESYLIFNHPYVGVVFLGALKDVSFTKSPIHIVPILKINVSKHKNKQDINNCTKVRTLKKQVKIINRAAQLMILVFD